MTMVQDLARFVSGSSFDSLSGAARRELKVRILDALGCAIGALEGEPIRMLQALLDDFGGREAVSLIGGGKTAPDRAALYNGALVRYLDFNDAYLAKGESCHPSDNLAAVLAAAEYAGASGKTLLTALAVAYQVQCRLSDVAPVRNKGFDHTTQGAYAVAAGVSRALGLDPEPTANAIAISGTVLNALRVTRTGRLSHWKGLAYPYTGSAATQATFMAMHGVTGPAEVFEGNKGFMEAIAGQFELDWSKEDLQRVTQTIVKKYNAEVHAQAAIEGLLELQAEHGFQAEEIARIEIDTFDVAYHIIGGGAEGDKTLVARKEEADHSLPYMVSVALLDGQVLPEQYLPARIVSEDVQRLLRKVIVRPNVQFSRRFPEEMPCRLVVHLKAGRTLVREKRDYEGFFTRPLPWEGAVAKFERLSAPYAELALRQEIVQAVAELEDIGAADLMGLLRRVPDPKRADGPA